jgi:hypothetical protein
LNDFLRVWEYQTFAAIPYFDQTGIGEIFAFAKPFFDPRESCSVFGSTSFVSVSGGQPLCVILGRFALFVVVDAAF